MEQQNECLKKCLEIVNIIEASAYSIDIGVFNFNIQNDGFGFFEGKIEPIIFQDFFKDLKHANIND